MKNEYLEAEKIVTTKNFSEEQSEENTEDNEYNSGLSYDNCCSCICFRTSAYCKSICKQQL